jgi:hypothetical protein
VSFSINYFLTITKDITMTIRLEIISTDPLELGQQLKQLTHALLGHLDNQSVTQTPEHLQEHKPEQMEWHSPKQKDKQKPKQMLEQKLETKIKETEEIQAPEALFIPEETKISNENLEENNAPEKPIDRDSLKSLIKEIHQTHGDKALTEIQKVINSYGARKQSEVKDEDIADVYAKLVGLL